jgi:hypothetical protein
LAQELETTHTSLTATCDKLTIKSTALDNMVIQRDETKIQLAKAEEKLKAAEEELKIVRQTLSKRETSSSTVITLVVAILQHCSRAILLVLTWRFCARTSLLMTQSAKC